MEINKAALDRYITGNYGEDQLRGECDDEPYARVQPGALPDRDSFMAFMDRICQQNARYRLAAAGQAIREDTRMTSLEKRKTRLIFQTSDVVRERGRLRQVIIEAETNFCFVRLSGMRRASAFPISYAAIFHAAAKIQVERQRAERKQKRGQKHATYSSIGR